MGKRRMEKAERPAAIGWRLRETISAIAWEGSKQVRVYPASVVSGGKDGFLMIEATMKADGTIYRVTMEGEPLVVDRFLLVETSKGHELFDLTAYIIAARKNHPCLPLAKVVRKAEDAQRAFVATYVFPKYELSQIAFRFNNRLVVGFVVFDGGSPLILADLGDGVVAYTADARPRGYYDFGFIHGARDGIPRLCLAGLTGFLNLSDVVGIIRGDHEMVVMDPLALLFDVDAQSGMMLNEDSIVSQISTNFLELTSADLIPELLDIRELHMLSWDELGEVIGLEFSVFDLKMTYPQESYRKIQTKESGSHFDIRVGPKILRMPLASGTWNLGSPKETMNLRNGRLANVCSRRANFRIPNSELRGIYPFADTQTTWRLVRDAIVKVMLRVPSECRTRAATLILDFVVRDPLSDLSVHDGLTVFSMPETYNKITFNTVDAGEVIFEDRRNGYTYIQLDARGQVRVLAKMI